MFKYYQDAAGEWRWRFKARNGLIMADSGEGYSTRSNARRAALRIAAIIRRGDLPDLLGPEK